MDTTYQPATKLFSALSDFFQEVCTDAKEALSNNPTATITLPDGIDGVTVEPMELTSVLIKGKWVNTITVNGDVLSPTDFNYDLFMLNFRAHLRSI